MPDTTPNGLPVPVSAKTRDNILYAPRATGLGSWLQGFWGKQNFPRETMNRGIFHYYHDRLETAEAFYLDALKTTRGRYYETYNNLGSIYFKGKQDKESAFCYMTVLKEQPNSPLAKLRLIAIRARQ
jgi:hypothetical protein